jgi:hypothetical protein
MGFRFQRRIRLFPGVRINLSKSGVSTSIGTRGAHVTVGHGQTRETVGLPGTGLSYTTARPTRRGVGLAGWLVGTTFVVLVVVWLVQLVARLIA